MWVPGQRIGPRDRGDGNKLDPGDRIILVAIHKNGVNDEWSDLTPPNFSITDMDYIIGMNTHTVTANPGQRYRVDIFPMINENIPVRETPFRIEDVYVFAVLDDNANGLLDQGEYIGYYWRLGLIFYLPEKMDIRANQSYFGESIRFTNQKF